MFVPIPDITSVIGLTYEISKVDWTVRSITKKEVRKILKPEKKGRVNIAGKLVMVYTLAKLAKLPPKKHSMNIKTHDIPGIVSDIGFTYVISNEWDVFSVDQKGNATKLIQTKNSQVQLPGKSYAIYDIAKRAGLPPKEWPEDECEWDEVPVDTANGMRYRISECGKYFQSMNQHGKVVDMTLTMNGDGYMQTSLGSKVTGVHVIMGMTRFVPKPSNMPPNWTVHHKKSEETTNNHYTNLEWASPETQAKERRPIEQPRIYAYTVIGTALSGVVMVDGHIVLEDECVYFDTSQLAEDAIAGGVRTHISNCIRGIEDDHAGFSWKTPPSEPELPYELFESVGTNKCYERSLSNHGRIKFAYLHGYSKIVTAAEMMTERSHRDKDKYPVVNIDGKLLRFHRKVVDLFFCELPETIEIDGREHRLIVDHDDDIKVNARLGNLQLLTQQENVQKRHLKSYTTSVASALNGKFERSYKTRAAAIEFVKERGYPEALLEELNAKVEFMAVHNIPAELYGRKWIRAHFETMSSNSP
jgi:hypothetical protein